jgi:hypothetical protein
MPQGLKPRVKPPERGCEPSLPLFDYPALKRRAIQKKTILAAVEPNIGIKIAFAFRYQKILRGVGPGFR